MASSEEGFQVPQDTPNTDEPAPEKRKPGRPRGPNYRPKGRKRAAATTPKAPRGRPSAPGPDALLLPLTQLYTLAGMGLAAFPAYRADGLVIVTQAEGTAQAWVALAKADKRVLAALRKVVVGNAWGGVIFAHLAIAVPIAANHNLLPAAAGAALSMLTPDEGGAVVPLHPEAETDEAPTSD